jgi:NADPH2:quinone reductase
MTLPASMQEVRFTQAGGPEVIVIETAPLPVPGPGQVLVQVVGAGINRPDCIQRAGGYPPPPGATDIPGLEISGRVVACGEAVTHLAIGDEVCALVISGGYAEYCIADAALCLPIPAGLSLFEAGALPENVFTVYDNVFTRGQLKAGNIFLVHGGSSGIGYTAIQLAKQAGATVITTAGSDEKCEFCRAMGADFAINYRVEDWAQRVKEITQRKGVDVILDMVGGTYLQKNANALALEGRLVQIAFLESSRTEFDFRPMMLRRLTLTGSTLRPRSVEMKAAIAENVRAHVWPLYASGKIKPVIHAVFPLREARAAHELMESSAHIGKIMLKVGN